VSPGVLFVCYANRCRSPMAEGLARLMLAQAGRSDVSVGSAGTHARVGTALHPHAATALAARGVTPWAFGSSLLPATAIADAGLILTASRHERSACAALTPGAIRRTFTLRQFARLAAAASTADVPSVGLAPGPLLVDRAPPVDQLAVAVAAAAAARSRLQPIDAALDDLADPIGEPLAAFQACAAMISAALEPALRLITGCG
jgi:protein-tyrosine phosphatase